MDFLPGLVIVLTMAWLISRLFGFLGQVREEVDRVILREDRHHWEREFMTETLQVQYRCSKCKRVIKQGWCAPFAGCFRELPLREKLKRLFA